MAGIQNIRDRDTRAEVYARLRELSSTTTPSFGTLDAPRMLCHLQDQIRVALGDVDCRERKSVYRFAPLRWLALKLPVPKEKLRTVREMQQTEPGGWDADLKTLEELTERLAVASKTSPHPVLGSLTPKAWGVLTWKHYDHHLKQFGV